MTSDHPHASVTDRRNTRAWLKRATIGEKLRPEHWHNAKEYVGNLQFLSKRFPPIKLHFLNYNQLWTTTSILSIFLKHTVKFNEPGKPLYQASRKFAHVQILGHFRI